MEDDRWIEVEGEEGEGETAAALRDRVEDVMMLMTWLAFKLTGIEFDYPQSFPNLLKVDKKRGRVERGVMVRSREQCLCVNFKQALLSRYRFEGCVPKTVNE